MIGGDSPRAMTWKSKDGRESPKNDRMDRNELLSIYHSQAMLF